MTRRALTPVTIALLALGLAGCSASANLTVSASKIADTAATALQDELGGDKAELDCGDGQVDLVVGTEVECTYTDPESGEDYDAVVTITQVDGSDFSINASVPDLPVGGSEEPSDDDVITVPGSEVAGVAAGALAPQLGFDPTITCNEDIELVVDNSIRCMISGEGYAAATVLITITEVNGAQYFINAEVQ